MRLLLIHQNLPGQYRHLLVHYGRQPDCHVVGLGELRRIKENIRRPVPGVQLVGYESPPGPSAASPANMRTTEAAVARGEMVLRALVTLKKAGFYPDVVYAHPGWGETLFLKDVFPAARLIHFCEFYYESAGQDFNFDPEYPSDAADLIRLRVRNMHHLMAVEQADVGVSPTVWQKTRFPRHYHPKIEVVHDGVDTSRLKPDPEAYVSLPSKGLTLRRDDEVVTFVSRNLEPYRGFHMFMRALPQILRERPNAHVIIVGGDDVSYGSRLSQGTYREKYMAEVGDSLDMRRVHFVGKLPYDIFVRLLQVSSAHVYLTYPFVLSWSMMEAMALGCLVIGSRTPPVEEVIRHGENGLLVDFFSPEEIAEAVIGACERPAVYQALRENARLTILRDYDLETVCLPRQKEIISSSMAVA